MTANQENSKATKSRVLSLVLELNRWQALGRNEILKRLVRVGGRILPDLLTTTEE